MNTAIAPLAAIKVASAGPEISYVINEPTGPWQVVVSPDNDYQVLWIEGYGVDLELPLLSEEIPCRASSG